jgi:energy-coupling factor transporter ATP-binding protein EcfA2
MVKQAVGSMSGGEKARLVLCMIVWQRPNLLLLDEPTNHLDLATREALAMALNEFEGTVMLVSHDRALLRSVCDEFWMVSRGGVEPFRRRPGRLPALPARRSQAPNPMVALFMVSAPALVVMTMITLRKSALRPLLSVSVPWSITCSNTLKIAGCAFSISSSNNTQCGFLVMASVSKPPWSKPT